MSHKVITLVNSRTVGSQPQKAVLSNMADKASDGGEGVFASKATIAKETELGLSTVKRAINDLLERGLIREVGQRGCANGHTVVYDLDVRAIAALPAWKNDDVTPSRADLVQSGRGPERAVTPSRADPHPVQSGPLTILEPSLNQEAIASSPADADATEAVEVYNAAAARSGWSAVQRMNKPRLSALKARLKEAGGMPGWIAAMERAEASDFLCGRRPGRDGPFFASFDFLTQASSFTRLMEGNYDNRAAQHHRSPPPSQMPENRPDPALANIARIVGLGAAQGHGRG